MGLVERYNVFNLRKFEIKSKIDFKSPKKSNFFKKKNDIFLKTEHFDNFLKEPR